MIDGASVRNWKHRSEADLASDIADLLTLETRQRLLERLAELDTIDRLMREPGTLAGPGCCRDDTTERTNA